MDKVELPYGNPLKDCRADVAKVTMATFSIIETLNKEDQIS
jgi:hypothetical protein